MGFKFGLEVVLKHRKALRDLAQKELNDAENRLQEHLRSINDMFREVDASRNLAAQEQAQSKIDMNRLSDLENYILSVKVKIKEARNRSRDFMQVVEEKRDALVEKAREFRSIELLKEKRKEEYLQEHKRKEMKKLDDIVQMRHKREKVS